MSSGCWGVIRHKPRSQALQHPPPAPPPGAARQTKADGKHGRLSAAASRTAADTAFLQGAECAQGTGVSRAAGPKTPKRQNEKRHSREPVKGGNFGGERTEGGSGRARKRVGAQKRVLGETGQRGRVCGHCGTGPLLFPGLELRLPHDSKQTQSSCTSCAHGRMETSQASGRGRPEPQEPAALDPGLCRSRCPE